MNLFEAAKRIGEKILRVEVEPLGDAVRRFHGEYEKVHSAHDEVIAGARLVDRIDGELPEDLQRDVEASQDRYRLIREREASGLVSRNVEVVLFGGAISRKGTILTKLRNIS